MTIENENGEVGQTTEDTTSKDSGDGYYQEEIKKLVKERDNWKSKARTYETAAKSAELWEKQIQELTVEKSKIHTEYSAFKEKIRDANLQTQLSTALEAAGARSINGALKLIDKSQIVFKDDGDIDRESVITLVEGLRTSEPWAFKEAETPEKKEQENQTITSLASTNTTTTFVPKPVPAVQSITEGAFEKEIRACKSNQELLAVMAKYGK